jgi:hypothetical protein
MTLVEAMPYHSEDETTKDIEDGKGGTIYKGIIKSYEILEIDVPRNEAIVQIVWMDDFVTVFIKSNLIHIRLGRPVLIRTQLIVENMARKGPEGETPAKDGEGEEEPVYECMVEFKPMEKAVK